MTMKTKTCPHCQAENLIIRKVCAECGKPCKIGPDTPKKKKKAAPEPDEPGFSAGVTDEGGLMLFWYGRNEYTKLSRNEAELVRSVLATKAVAA